MALSTYDDLLTTTGNWLNRGDLTAYIPDYVALVEARLRRLLRSKNVTFNAALAIDGAAVSLGLGIKEIRSLSINEYGVVDPVSPAKLFQLRVDYPVAGVPRYVANVNDVLMFAPEPDQVYVASIVYEPDISALASAGSNWVLTNHPDIYLYGVLVEASPFLRDDPRVPMFESRFTTALAELEVVRDRSEYPNTPVATPHNPAP